MPSCLPVGCTKGDTARAGNPGTAGEIPLQHLTRTNSPDTAYSCALQYHLLEHNYNIHFKLHLKDGIAPVNNVRVHYMLASPQALMEMVGTTQVTLDMVE